MNKQERRKVRERKVGEARAAVAEYARARRIAATQEEIYRLAEARDVAGFRALLDTDAGRELGAYNARKLEPLPVTPRPRRRYAIRSGRNQFSQRSPTANWRSPVTSSPASARRNRRRRPGSQCRERSTAS
jgi:hypothetical protein